MCSVSWKWPSMRFFKPIIRCLLDFQIWKCVVFWFKVKFQNVFCCSCYHFLCKLESFHLFWHEYFSLLWNKKQRMLVEVLTLSNWRGRRCSWKLEWGLKNKVNQTLNQTKSEWIVLIPNKWSWWSFRTNPKIRVSGNVIAKKYIKGNSKDSDWRWCWKRNTNL